MRTQVTIVMHAALRAVVIALTFLQERLVLLNRSQVFVVLCKLCDVSAQFFHHIVVRMSIRTCIFVVFVGVFQVLCVLHSCC